MRISGIAVFLVLSLVLAEGPAPAQTVDLSGTWIGDTWVPNSEEKDNLTLVLKKDGTSYSGTITDSMGMLVAAVLEKVKLEKDTLTFEFVARPGAQDLRIRAVMKLTGEKLAGSWESEMGDGAPLELVRKK